ncbi:hypothetical protein ABT160_18910 [Streptomyces sp. NPDC001941]|uniref:hypothetical protein n=1 Tax=Streptomyces sp. NPDC001941 TaxID=3154659 RepID=UPI0033323E07
MNKYGRRAQNHWVEHRPDELADLDDSKAFFADLGADVAHEVRTRWTEARLTASRGEGESFLERVSRLQYMRHEAEREALRELVLLPAEPDPDLPADSLITQAELVEEQWREQHLEALAAGRSRAADFSAAERARLRAGAVPRLLELTGLSDVALARQGLR